MFAKVFEQIFDSTIAEDYTARHVFMDLLVLADSEGAVDMTDSAIARRTNVPIAVITRALKSLSSVDRESRSPAEDGRRIVPLDASREWGWRIVNYLHYRKVLDEEARRSYFRDYRRKERAGKRGESEVPVQDVQPCSTKFTQGTPSSSSSGIEAVEGVQGEGNGVTHARHGVTRPTLEQATSFAGQLLITAKEAEDWWNTREASDWMKATGGGGTTPVGSNWQADLKTYTNRMRESAAEKKSRNKGTRWEREAEAMKDTTGRF